MRCENVKETVDRAFLINLASGHKHHSGPPKIATDHERSTSMSLVETANRNAQYVKRSPHGPKLMIR